MNKKLPRSMEEFFNSDRITKSLSKAFLEFLNRCPSEVLNKTKNKIECLDMSHIVYKTYQVNSNPKKIILIEFGDLKDLEHVAIIGLIAHLFALISIEYHKNPTTNPGKWLKTDLYSDKIAKKWGFLNEIKNLRRIRPQKLPDEIQYPNIVLDQSAPSKKFDTDIRSALKKRNKSSLNNNKIWYVNRFSMVCGLERLCNDNTKHLHIFTNKYTKKKLENIL